MKVLEALYTYSCVDSILNIVKPTQKVTSIKQSRALKRSRFSCHVIPIFVCI